VRDENRANGILGENKGLICESRSVGQCQAAIAEAIEAFGRVDVLLGCTSEGIYCIYFLHPSF
jgi:hypothetical protein